MSNNQCKNCGGKVVFDPKSQKLVCEYCHSSQDIVANNKLHQEKKINLDLYTCPSCGAKIVTEFNNITSFCVYCKNQTISRDRLTGDFHPQGIIPFTKTKDDAIKAFELLKKNKKLIPSEFLDTKNIEEIRGIYIPFWLLDIKVKGTMKATTKTSDIKYAFDGVNHNETIKKYNSTRSGDIGYKNVPVDGSLHFDDTIMQSIEPFDYKELKPYTSDYLLGFLAEIYDVSSNDAFQSIEKKIKEAAYDIYKKSFVALNTTNVKILSFDYKSEKVKEQYVLLPVYLLNVKYKNNIYTFAMNGQTGKMIGNIPSSRKKEIIYFIIQFINFFIIGGFVLAIFNDRISPLIWIVFIFIITFVSYILTNYEKSQLKMENSSSKEINSYIDDRVIEVRENNLIKETVIDHVGEQN